MAEQAFRDSDDPADLPLFAPAPAPRPGRVRSTFSMRIDPVATRDDGEASAASPPDAFAGQECAAGVGSAAPAGRLAGGSGWTGRWWRGCERRHRNG